MSKTVNTAKPTLPALLAALIVGCGGSGGSSTTTSTSPSTPDADDTSGGGSTPITPPAQPATYSLSGTVTGLLAGADTFVVLDAGIAPAITVRVEDDGAFAFPDEIDNGTAYSVIIADAQTPAPNTLVCAVSGGQGTVNDADITGIDVQCEVVGPDDSRSLPAEAQLAADLWALGQYGLVTEIAATWAGTPDGDTFFASTIEPIGSPVASAQSFNCANGGTMVVSQWLDGTAIYDSTGNLITVSGADGLFNTPDEQTVAFTDCDMFGVPDLALTSVSFSDAHRPYVVRGNGTSLAGPFKLSGRAPVPMSYMVGGTASSGTPGSVTFTRSAGNPLAYAFDDTGSVLAMIQNATMTYTDEFSSVSGHEEVSFMVDFQAPVDTSDPFVVPIPAADLTTPVKVELDSNDYMVGGMIRVIDRRGDAEVSIEITPNPDPTLVNLSIDLGGDGSFETVDLPIRWDAFTDDQILTRFTNRGGFSN